MLPLATKVPPVDASYQSTVRPDDTEAVSVADSAPQVPLLAEATGAAGTVFTVALTAVLVAEAQFVEVTIALTK